MSRFTLKINGKQRHIDAEDDTPLLWVIRDHVQLTGTKYGCGIGSCGACTVQVDGQAIRSCQVTAISLQNKTITTIEGLSEDSSHAVQQAWLSLQIPQCGYCQSAQIMTAATLLDNNTSPSDQDIDAVMSPILCRCGTYQRIRAGVHLAAKLIRERA